MKGWLASVCVLAGLSCGVTQGATAPSMIPSILRISPTSGPPGTTVEVTGESFAPTGNLIQFGRGYITNLDSTDGKTLRFVVPSELDPCPPRSFGLGMPCMGTTFPVEPGDYTVVVVTRAGSSADPAPSFTVRRP